MNGRVLTNPPIAIDFWKLNFADNVRYYFLTHVHSDHTNGLNSNWTMPIYCSSLTRKIILEKFKIAPEFLYDLEIGVPTILFLDAEETKSMQVTLIDANHCPGSVMLHFKGEFGQILYTGDFKYSHKLYNELVAAIPHFDVDHLYFDDTHWNSGILPPAEKSIKEIMKIIENHPGHKILIALYNFGKEYLLELISDKFKTAICTSEKRKKMLQLIGFKGEIVTSDKDSNIRAVERWKVQKELLISSESHPSIAIIPSAFMRRDELQNPNIFVILLTDHSSHEELERFIKVIEPSHVTGITGKFNTSGVCRRSKQESTPTSRSAHKQSKTSSNKRRIERTPVDYENENNDNKERTHRKKTKLIEPTSRRRWSNCSRCGGKFEVEKLKYNRNKDEKYDPGLCSPCDVAISQLMERRQLKKKIHS